MLYQSVVELGPGVYGAEAIAGRYYDKVRLQQRLWHPFDTCLDQPTDRVKRPSSSCNMTPSFVIV